VSEDAFHGFHASPDHGNLAGTVSRRYHPAFRLVAGHLIGAVSRRRALLYWGLLEPAAISFLFEKISLRGLSSSTSSHHSIIFGHRTASVERARSVAHPLATQHDDSATLDKIASLQFGDCLPQLFLRVHYDGAIPGDGFLDWLT
jgi:hypothetical protein